MGETHPLYTRYNPFDFVTESDEPKVPTAETRRIMRKALREIDGITRFTYLSSIGEIHCWTSVKSDIISIQLRLAELLGAHPSIYTITRDKCIGLIEIELESRNGNGRDAPSVDSDVTPTKIETGFDHMGPEEPVTI